MLDHFRTITRIEPTEYELRVKAILDAQLDNPGDYTSTHLEKLQGIGGAYIIDITTRFTVGGVSYLTLVECKAQRRNVERAEVIELHGKLQALGAHKGILFATSGFQLGAVEYAKAHGIALAKFTDGVVDYRVKCEESSLEFFDPSPPTYQAVWVHGIIYVVMSAEEADPNHTLCHFLSHTSPIPIASEATPSAGP